MNWGRVIWYASALFVAGILVGVVEGLLFPPSGAVFLGGAVVSFVICGAIFAHLAARQPFRPFIHAWAALLLDQAVASAVWLVLAQLAPGWFGSTPWSLIVAGWLVLVCALEAGTALGISLRHRARHLADA
jgi:hypothetical protein